MKPGRKLDALVAERIFGYKSIEDLERSYISPEGDHIYKDFVGAPESMKLPRFSTSIAAAWEVVEKLKGSFLINTDHGTPAEWSVNWIVILGDELPKNVGAIGVTAPHAICLAALKAVGEHE